MKKYLSLGILLLVSSIALGVYVEPPYPFSNGGTSATTQQGALNAIAGAVTNHDVIRCDGTNCSVAAIQAADVPTLNQNTSGSAASLSATLVVPSGGTGQTSFTSGHPILGNGSSALSQGTISGNTSEFATANGVLTSGHCVQIDASGNFVDAGSACGAGAGSVTSVAMTVPSYLTVTGSPITTSGTLAVTGTSEAQNLFLASPNGSAGALSPRAIVAADVPTLNQNTTGTAANVTGIVAAANGGTGINTSASTGMPSISAGTWSISSLLVTFQNLYETVVTTAGGIIYGGVGGIPTALPIGTAGQYLTVNGGATAPVWATGPSGASPANWAGTSTLTGTTTSTSFADFGSVSGSVTVSGTPSNVTCSAASSLVGITCTLPASTGNYQICFAGSASNGTLGDTAYTQLVDGSGTVIVGSQEVYSAAASSTGPVGSCGGYTTSSTSVTFKVQGKVNAGTETLLATSFSVFSVQNGGNVASNSTGQEHIERVRVSAAGAITSQSGLWVTGVTGSSGQYVVSFAGGEFSSTPTCTCTVENGSTTVGICSIFAISSSSAAIYTTQDSFTAETANPFSMICMGPH